MKQILHKPETSGRLVKWIIELSVFKIRYKLRTTIKGQVLANFIMEFTSTEPTETSQLASDLPIWRLSIDGAANAQESGAGLIMTSPDGIKNMHSDSGSKPPIMKPNMKLSLSGLNSPTPLRLIN